MGGTQSLINRVSELEIKNKVLVDLLVEATRQNNSLKKQCIENGYLEKLNAVANEIQEQYESQDKKITELERKNGIS